jgi:hypothetical protein
MLDARTEIDRLRQRLRFKHLSESIIDEICDDVSKDISMATADILADAMQQAVDAGGNVGSEAFIEELRAVRTGPSFEIATDSGKTDFSEPPFPMLPKLLKNAKTAKDGSLYKIIPMKEKSSISRVSVTTEAAIENINNARRIAKEQRDAEKETDRGTVSPDPMRGMDTFSAMQSINRARHGSKQKIRNEKGPVTNFKTASSKQDPSSQWVMPGKTMDLTGPLRDINMNMHDNIDRVIENIIRSYDDMF